MTLVVYLKQPHCTSSVCVRQMSYAISYASSWVDSYWLVILETTKNDPKNGMKPGNYLSQLSNNSNECEIHVHCILKMRLDLDGELQIFDS